MRTYESIFIVHPDVVGDDQIAIIDKYKTVLSEQGATVLKVDNWGVRTLAYPVKKHSRGCYVLVVFEAEPNVIAEFERRMRIDDMVIKFQTVLLENGYEAPIQEAETEKESEGSSGQDEQLTTSESETEEVSE